MLREKKAHPPEILSGWKSIARHLGMGVRTVQRYERQLGLPIRRPAGKLRGAVLATKLELDAWIAASPVRQVFQLTTVPSPIPSMNAVKAGVAEMHTLREQMLALRDEVRASMSSLRNSIETLHAGLRPNTWDNPSHPIPRPQSPPPPSGRRIRSGNEQAESQLSRCAVVPNDPSRLFLHPTGAPCSREFERNYTAFMRIMDQLLANGRAWNRARVNFLMVDAQTALTLARIAAQPDDAIKKGRNQRAARKAYDTVNRFAKDVELTPADARTLYQRLARLKCELRMLGEPV
jgi:hypothetical protein